MIPFLDLEPLLQAPAGHPASKAEVIQLICWSCNLELLWFPKYPLPHGWIGRVYICLEQGGCQGEALAQFPPVIGCSSKSTSGVPQSDKGCLGKPPASWSRASCADTDSQIIVKIVNLKQVLQRKGGTKE